MATIGRTMVVPKFLVGANVNRAVSVLRPVDRGQFSEYFSWYFRSPEFRQTFVEKQLGTAQQRINLGDLVRFPVPVAPQREATVLLAALQAKLRHHEVAKRTLDESLHALDIFARATLAKAFRGELVPQDARDEPAEAMLARVRGANGANANGAEAAKPNGRLTRRIRGAAREET